MEILREQVSYKIHTENFGMKVEIFVESDITCDFACYLRSGSVIIEKKMYQESNIFTFSALKGEYVFTLFVRIKGQKEPAVIFETETIQIGQNLLLLITNNEKIIKAYEGDGNFSCIIADTIENIHSNFDCVLLDLLYLVEKQPLNDLLEGIQEIDVKQQTVVLIESYCEKSEVNQKIKEIIYRAKTKNFNGSVISTHQILREEGGVLKPEDSNAFTSLLRNDLYNILRPAYCQYDDALVSIMLLGNVFKAEIKCPKSDSSCQYLFYCLRDGEVLYKQPSWSNEKTFSLPLSENGIYMIQGYIRGKGGKTVVKSHTLEFFLEPLKMKFNTFLRDESFLKTGRKIPFFKLRKPFIDFCFITSKEKQELHSFDDFYFEERGLSKTGYCYIVCGEKPKHGQDSVESLFSGLIMEDGNISLDFRGGYEARACKYTGMYTVAFINEDSFYFSNDFFNFNRLFYYSANGICVVSNRYHMLLLLLANLGISLELYEEKALLTLSTVSLQFLTQNTMMEMDVKGVYKCPNSFDICIDDTGLHLIRNSYGMILDSSKYLDEKEYREQLFKGKEEIEQNIASILNFPDIDKAIVDLSGGLDSRIVYGLSIRNKNSERIIINSENVPNTRDLEIAVKINEMYGYPWDELRRKKIERSIIDCGNRQRSFYLGTYYSHSMGKHDELTEERVVKLNGACGEILLRPYLTRKFFGTRLEELNDVRDFFDFILRDYSPLVISDYDKAAHWFLELHVSQRQYFQKCSLEEMVDLIYLEHRHAYHFDEGLRNNNSNTAITFDMMPLQSKTLFDIHHNIYDKEKNLKLQFDLTNLIDPYLAAFENDFEKDNSDKAAILDKLYFTYPYERKIKMETTENRERYNQAYTRKQQNITFKKLSENQNFDMKREALRSLQYICNKNEVIRNNVGLALYFFLTSREKVDGRQIRYLYNKLVSIEDQLRIIE